MSGAAAVPGENGEGARLTWKSQVVGRLTQQDLGSAKRYLKNDGEKNGLSELERRAKVLCEANSAILPQDWDSQDFRLATCDGPLLSKLNMAEFFERHPGTQDLRLTLNRVNHPTGQSWVAKRGTSDIVQVLRDNNYEEFTAAAEIIDNSIQYTRERPLRDDAPQNNPRWICVDFQQSNHTPTLSELVFTDNGTGVDSQGLGQLVNTGDSSAKLDARMDAFRTQLVEVASIWSSENKSNSLKQIFGPTRKKKELIDVQWRDILAGHLLGELSVFGFGLKFAVCRLAEEAHDKIDVQLISTPASKTTGDVTYRLRRHEDSESNPREDPLERYVVEPEYRDPNSHPGLQLRIEGQFPDKRSDTIRLLTSSREAQRAFATTYELYLNSDAVDALQDSVLGNVAAARVRSPVDFDVRIGGKSLRELLSAESVEEDDLGDSILAPPVEKTQLVENLLKNVSKTRCVTLQRAVAMADDTFRGMVELKTQGQEPQYVFFLVLYFGLRPGREGRGPYSDSDPSVDVFWAGRKLLKADQSLFPLFDANSSEWRGQGGQQYLQDSCHTLIFAPRSVKPALNKQELNDKGNIIKALKDVLSTRDKGQKLFNDLQQFLARAHANHDQNLVMKSNCELECLKDGTLQCPKFKSNGGDPMCVVGSRSGMTFFGEFGGCKEDGQTGVTVWMFPLDDDQPISFSSSSHDFKRVSPAQLDEERKRLEQETPSKVVCLQARTTKRKATPKPDTAGQKKTFDLEVRPGRGAALNREQLERHVDIASCKATSSTESDLDTSAEIKEVKAEGKAAAFVIRVYVTATKTGKHDLTFHVPVKKKKIVLECDAILNVTPGDITSVEITSVNDGDDRPLILGDDVTVKFRFLDKFQNLVPSAMKVTVRLFSKRASSGASMTSLILDELARQGPLTRKDLIERVACAVESEGRAVQGDLKNSLRGAVSRMVKKREIEEVETVAGKKVRSVAASINVEIVRSEEHRELTFALEDATATGSKEKSLTFCLKPNEWDPIEKSGAYAGPNCDLEIESLIKGRTVRSHAMACKIMAGKLKIVSLSPVDAKNGTDLPPRFLQQVVGRDGWSNVCQEEVKQQLSSSLNDGNNVSSLVGGDSFEVAGQFKLDTTWVRSDSRLDITLSPGFAVVAEIYEEDKTRGLLRCCLLDLPFDARKRGRKQEGRVVAGPFSAINCDCIRPGSVIIDHVRYSDGSGHSINVPFGDQRPAPLAVFIQESRASITELDPSADFLSALAGFESEIRDDLDLGRLWMSSDGDLVPHDAFPDSPKKGTGIVLVGPPALALASERQLISDYVNVATDSAKGMSIPFCFEPCTDFAKLRVEAAGQVLVVQPGDENSSIAMPVGENSAVATLQLLDEVGGYCQQKHSARDRSNQPEEFAFNENGSATRHIRPHKHLFEIDKKIFCFDVVLQAGAVSKVLFNLPASVRAGADVTLANVRTVDQHDTVVSASLQQADFAAVTAVDGQYKDLQFGKKSWVLSTPFHDTGEQTVTLWSRAHPAASGTCTLMVTPGAPKKVDVADSVGVRAVQNGQPFPRWQLRLLDAYGNLCHDRNLSQPCGKSGAQMLCLAVVKPGRQVPVVKFSKGEAILEGKRGSCVYSKENLVEKPTMSLDFGELGKLEIEIIPANLPADLLWSSKRPFQAVAGEDCTDLITKHVVLKLDNGETRVASEGDLEISCARWPTSATYKVTIHAKVPNVKKDRLPSIEIDVEVAPGPPGDIKWVPHDSESGVVRIFDSNSNVIDPKSLGEMKVDLDDKVCSFELSAGGDFIVQLPDGIDTGTLVVQIGRLAKPFTTFIGPDLEKLTREGDPPYFGAEFEARREQLKALLEEKRNEDKFQGRGAEQRDRVGDCLEITAMQNKYDINMLLCGLDHWLTRTLALTLETKVCPDQRLSASTECVAVLEESEFTRSLPGPQRGGEENRPILGDLIGVTAKPIASSEPIAVLLRRRLQRTLFKDGPVDETLVKLIDGERYDACLALEQTQGHLYRYVDGMLLISCFEKRDSAIRLACVAPDQRFGYTKLEAEIKEREGFIKRRKAIVAALKKLDENDAAKTDLEKRLLTVYQQHLDAQGSFSEKGTDGSRKRQADSSEELSDTDDTPAQKRSKFR